MLFYGEYGANGEIVKDTQNCILTGQPFRPGDVTINLSGSRYFVRVKASKAGSVTPEMLAELLKAIQAENPQPKKPGAPAPKGE